MKKHLKKKTKIQDIVFPSSLLRSEQPIFNHPEQSQSIALVSRKPSLNSKHRTLSRSNEKTQKTNRSVSLGKKTDKNTISHRAQQSRLGGWPREKFAKARSTLKKRNNSNSAAEIASLFYKGMQKNLVLECQSILRMEKQTRSQSSCQLQALNQHLFLVRKTNQEGVVKEVAKKEEVVEQQTELVQILEPTSMVRVDTASDSSENGNNQELQRQAQLQDLQFSDGPLTSIKRIEDSLLKKKSDLMDKRPLVTSHKSIMNSQTRFQKLCNSLISTKAHMVSSKMLAKSVGLFSINKVEFHSKAHRQLSLLFEIAGQVVFKKIKPIEKQPAQLKLRKYHMRMQHMRQRSQDKIFNHFSRKGVTTSLISLYEDILAYIEQHTMIDRSYRGLILIDQDDNNLIVSNPERILEILNINSCFYFILRLGSTFYLVKATSNELRGIHFTFLCDFATLSTGDQLVFPHFTPFAQTKPKKFKTAMSKAVFEFKQAAEDQWSRGAQNTEVLAKIGKVTIQTLQRQDLNNLGLWTVNKKYAMVGETTNFFEMHDHFDYGFFKKQLNYFKAGVLFYTLSKRKPILFYHYPCSYELLQVNQMQREALVIAHLPSQHRPNHFQERAICSFYRRHHNRLHKISNRQFILRLKKQIITVQVAEQMNLFIESATTLKGHKIKLSNQKGLNATDPSNVTRLSEAIEKTLSEYRLEQSFLYKRYQPVNKPEILVYYKALHKFQGHFAFVSLYKLERVNLIEFKIYTFQIGRSFVIHLEKDQLSPDTVKQTVSNLINVFKNTYFKKVLQLQIRKSQKRKKDALQDFFRNQIKFNPSNMRVKRKNEDQLRKKNLMRIGSVRPSAECNPIEQILISKLWKTHDGKDCFFSLRFLSEKEVKESKGDSNQKIVLCLYFSNKMTYFRYLCSLKDLTSIAIPQWSANQQLDPRQLLCVLQIVTQNLMSIIKHTDSSFKFLFARLKHFLNPNQAQKKMPVHPYLFRLIGRNIFETKEEIVKATTSLSTKLSIDLDIQRDFNLGSSYIIEDFDNNCGQLKLASPSLEVFKQNSVKNVEITYMVDVAPSWMIQVVDVYDEAAKDSTAGLIERDRRVRLVDRTTDQCLQLGEWKADFLSNIRFANYNRRMLKRLLRGVRSVM